MVRRERGTYGQAQMGGRLIVSCGAVCERCHAAAAPAGGKKLCKMPWGLGSGTTKLQVALGIMGDNRGAAKWLRVMGEWSEETGSEETIPSISLNHLQE